MRKHAKMGNKKCSRCQTVKALNQFYNCVRNNDGKNGVCKQCFGVSAPGLGKATKRPCLGKYCRGEKLFKSYGGARLCRACKLAIKDNGDTYNEQIVVFSTSRKVK